MSKQKVLVAMSGGVDSSVAAALLKEQGFQVEGATMELWPCSDPVYTGGSAFCNVSAVEDARRVARVLGIPHHVIDVKSEFLEKVVNDFVDEYTGGRTPNPCVVCNREIKFGAFMRKALELGVDYIATGHYVQKKYDDQSGRYLLFKGRDTSKDQTYVLYSLTQDQLRRALFPLGTLTKQEIRELALDYKLPVAEKEDSQEICFIPDNDYRRFLQAKGAKIISGPFLDVEGNVIGTHRGLPFYTIGQRRGLGLALGFPAYVVAIDSGKNAVIVGSEKHLYSRVVLVKRNNFIPFERLSGSIQAAVKVRYKSVEAQADIAPGIEEGDVEVTFQEPQKAVTPGQSAVYYQGDMVIGGGIIHSAC